MKGTLITGVIGEDVYIMAICIVEHAFHKEKVLEQRRILRGKPGYQTLVNDLTAISRSRLLGT